VHLQRTTNICLSAKNKGEEQDYQRVLSIHAMAYSRLEEHWKIYKMSANTIPFSDWYKQHHD
jgi:hypothetical protein